MSEPTRRCNVCGIVYPLTTEFFYRTRSSFRRQCRRCHLDGNRAYHQSEKGSLALLLSHCRNSAKRAGREFSLTKEFLEENIVGKPCHYCRDTDVPVGCDRLDNSRGYVPENVVPACPLCNMIRGDRLASEEMLLLGPVIRAIKSRRRQEAASY